MAYLPAFCPRHGLVPTQFFVEGIEGGVVIPEGATTPCTVCGVQVPILPGTFELVDEVANLVSAPHWTWEKLAELRNTLLWARDLGITQPEEVLRRVEAVDPATASYLRQALDSMTFERWMLLLTLLATIIVPFLVAGLEDPGGLSEERVREIVEEMQQSDLPPLDPGAPPQAPPRRE